MGAVADEPVEIIDEQGTVIAVVRRAEMRAGNLRHRNIAVFVQRGDGRLVVHQRADWKDVYPSAWDIAFGGVPGVGEPDEDAAVRELAEEAGLTVDPEDLIYAGTLALANADATWRGRFFRVVTDADLHPADGEVQRMEEVPLAGLRHWARDHPLCPDAVGLLDRLEEWLG